MSSELNVRNCFFSNLKTMKLSDIQKDKIVQKKNQRK